MRGIEINGVVVTLREAVFSVTIASVFVLVGFMISTRIGHWVNQKNLRYRQAAIVLTNDGFSLAMRTDVGDAFVEGAFRTVDPVSHPKLDGRWLDIVADHQVYTRHTRTVTYTTTDSKGRVQTHTRVEHYWTWDTERVERLSAKRVSYSGAEFPYGKFDYSCVGRKFKTVDTGWHRRIEFSFRPASFRASAFATLANGTLTGGTTLHDGVSAEELRESMTRSYAVAVFWFFWILLTAGAVIGFVALENEWMEDRK